MKSLPQEHGWIDYLFYLSLFFYILWDAYAWFFWILADNPIASLTASLIICVISYFYKIRHKVSLSLSPPLLIAILSYSLAIFIQSEKISFGLLVIIVLKLYPFIVLLKVKDSQKIIVFLSKALAIILVPSIFIHIYLFFNDLPFILISHPSQDNYVFYNYFFALRGFEYAYNDIRFLSYFLEAGYAGVLFSFFLYINKYDFSKWYVKVIIVGLLLTLSLAGYSITVVGYFVTLFVEHRKKTSIVMSVIVLSLLYMVFSTYNGGNNPVNERLLSRLESDDEKGVKGNNRVSGDTDMYFDQLVENGGIFFGLGSSKVNQLNASGQSKQGVQGAGLVRFLVTNGLVCYLLYILFYYLLGHNAVKMRDKHVFGFMLLLLLTTFTLTMMSKASWIIPYILCINSSKKSVSKVICKS